MWLFQSTRAFFFPQGLVVSDLIGHNSLQILQQSLPKGGVLPGLQLVFEATAGEVSSPQFIRFFFAIEQEGQRRRGGSREEERQWTRWPRGSKPGDDAGPKDEWLQGAFPGEGLQEEDHYEKGAGGEAQKDKRRGDVEAATWVQEQGEEVQASGWGLQLIKRRWIESDHICQLLVYSQRRFCRDLRALLGSPKSHR